MVSWIKTVSLQGLRVLPVDVQVHISHGLPGFTIVGLPDKAVAESRERIRAALIAIGLALPMERITVNLSPADLLKEGSHYDLPVILGVLCAMGVISPEDLSGFIAVGELALDSTLVGVAGTLATALYCADNDMGLICPEACGSEAAWAKGIEILAARNLLSLLNHFKGKAPLKTPEPLIQDLSPPVSDIADVRGQEIAKRAIIIAAAGGHNVLLSGPPGSGKTLLASRLAGLLPPLLPEEALQVTMIHSAAGLLSGGRLIRQRPFRAPHHTSSQAALVGGGTRAKPGEMSLAHSGVLFLDELPEFPRPTLEAMRQPLEAGEVTIARAQFHITYPARIQLVAAMNPCRCGYLGDARRQCQRVPSCGRDYRARLSGPLLDRFDVFVSVPPVDIKELSQAKTEPTATPQIAERIAELRKAQLVRQGCLNAHLEPARLADLVPLDAESRDIIHKIADRTGLSARGYHRVLKVARTLADWAGETHVARSHISEALAYREETL